MADSGLLVTISGAALSLLFYENACGTGEQMGFLLGDVVMYVTKNVTDSERHEETVRRHIEITGVLTCPSAGSLYDHAGRVYEEALEDCVGDRSKRVVGWFRFRRGGRLVHTFRDKILHKELAKYFHKSNGSADKELFLACILNASATEKQSTHKFKHVLLRYENGVYLPVPLRINNLGGGTDRPDATDYMPTPATTRDHEPDVFTKFVKSLNLNLDHNSGSDLVMTIQTASERHLDSLIPKLCESDREVCDLESRVREIRSSIVKKVLNSDKLSTDNQQADESNRRVSMHMEGEQSVKTDVKQKSPPRTPNLYDDSSVNKYSPVSKNKTTSMTHNVINTNTKHNPSNSLQRPTSERINHNQTQKKSVESKAELFSDY